MTEAPKTTPPTEIKIDPSVVVTVDELTREQIALMASFYPDNSPQFKALKRMADTCNSLIFTANYFRTEYLKLRELHGYAESEKR